MSEPLSPKTRRNEESSPKLFKEDNMNKKKYPTPATIVIRLNGDETTEKNNRAPKCQVGDIVRVACAKLACGRYDTRRARRDDQC